MAARMNPIMLPDNNQANIINQSIKTTTTNHNDHLRHQPNYNNNQQLQQHSIEVYDDNSLNNDTCGSKNNTPNNNRFIRNSQLTRSARVRKFKFYQYKPVQQLNNNKRNNNEKTLLANVYDNKSTNNNNNNSNQSSPEPLSVLVPREDILQGRIPLVTEQSKELLDLDNQIIELEKQIDDLNKRSRISDSFPNSSKGGQLLRESNDLDEKFKLVNKKNDLLRRQMQLNILEQEKSLEKANEELTKELRSLISIDDSRKNKAQLERQQYLHNQLVALVNKRNELVVLLDHQQMEIEADKAIREELESVINGKGKQPKGGRHFRRDLGATANGRSGPDQNCCIQ